jgi:hypothetical protein
MIDRHCSRAFGPCYSTTLPGNYDSGKLECRDDDEGSEQRREDQVLSCERRLCSNIEYITKTTRYPGLYRAHLVPEPLDLSAKAT